MANLRFMAMLILNLVLVACTDKPLDFAGVEAGVQSRPIVGGAETLADAPEAAYLVMIYGEKNEKSYVCTGAFVSETTVLTAAHCLAKDISLMSMFFGVKPFSEEAIALPIQSIQMYPQDLSTQASGENRHDLAVIHFAGGLPLKAKIAQLPTREPLLRQESTFLALGYGRTDGNVESLKYGEDIGILREVLLDQNDLVEDQNFLRLNQNKGRGVCYGDSGGPILAIASDWAAAELVGVAFGVYGGSEGLSHDECRARSLYMNTRFYLKWIKENSAYQGTK